MSNRKAPDMINGNPTSSLVLFTLPIILGNLFQQLYNIVDSIVVGRCVGGDALAAVGTSSAITFLFVAIATGSSIGSTVVISQLYGAKQMKEMMTSIYTAIIAIVVIALVLTGIGILLNQSILRLMNTPEKLFDEASIYLHIYFLGLVFLFLYNITNAIFNALGESKIPLMFLTFSSILNIVLDLLFVIQYGQGVAGVAWATLISQALAAFLSLCVLLIRLRKFKTEEGIRYFDFASFNRMCKIALPSTLQQSIVSIGTVCVQSLVNIFGSVVMAGYAAATKIDNIAINPMVNIGNAVSTFTAQNIGANKPERVSKGYRAGIMMNAVICGVLLVLVFLFGDKIIGVFMDSGKSADSIAVGVKYIHVVSVFYFIMGFMNVTNGVLRGSGDIRFFMLSTLCNFSSRVIFAYTLSIFIEEHAIWWSIPIGWILGLIISRLRYGTGKWKTKSLVDDCHEAED
ncbi:MAG: MATE family efflux transporter [bacterium]|nr:MATE family efflux transporter [bacterium]